MSSSVVCGGRVPWQTILSSLLCLFFLYKFRISSSTLRASHYSLRSVHLDSVTFTTLTENLVRKPACEPWNIHQSPQSNVYVDPTTQGFRTNVTISFTLDFECPNNVQPVVVYAKENHRGDFHQANASSPMQFSFVSLIRTFQSSWIYHVVLSNVEVGNVPHWYQIQVFEDSLSDMSPLSSSPEIPFISPPLPSKPVRIGLIADWGDSKQAVKLMENLQRASNHPSDSEEESLSAVIVGGDISYANMHLPSWETWLTKMQPLFQSVPLLVAPGNHEIECDRSTFQAFQAYEHYFRVPNRVALAQRAPAHPRRRECDHPAEFLVTYNYGNSFYAYEHGMVQIVILNSYTNTTKDSVQYDWLLDTLQSVDRTVTPWLLIVFHCPLQTTFHGHNNETNPEMMMQDMEPLFVEYQANIILSGHNHAYVRSRPLRDGRVDSSGKAPIYLTIGTGGATLSQGPIHATPEDWVAHRDHTEYGFGDLQVVNATHAYFARHLNSPPKEANPDAQDSVWFVNYQTLAPHQPTSLAPNPNAPYLSIRREGDSTFETA